jgi:hypothetical protein
MQQDAEAKRTCAAEQRARQHCHSCCCANPTARHRRSVARNVHTSRWLYVQRRRNPPEPRKLDSQGGQTSVRSYESGRPTKDAPTADAL